MLSKVILISKGSLLAVKIKHVVVVVVVVVVDTHNTQPDDLLFLRTHLLQDRTSYHTSYNIGTVCVCLGEH